jgi:hypothetical protein
MLQVVSESPARESGVSSRRAHALADRLEGGARALADLASTLSEAEWCRSVPEDGRAVGVLVHQVASTFLFEIKLALTLAEGDAVKGVTADAIEALNAEHARDCASLTQHDTLDLLRRTSAAAVAIIRSLSDEDLARAAPVSLYADAPLSCQFVLEDLAVRHTYHHLARIRRALLPSSSRASSR